MTDYRIEELEDIEHVKQCVGVTKSAWTGIPDMETIPDHVFKMTGETGLLMGAINDEDEVVGYAMLNGNARDKDSMHLHAMGVERSLKGTGIGEDLMQQARKEVQDSNDFADIEKFTWTYEPLLGPHASLYISKLGGVATSYSRDMYGSQDNDATGGNLPTERFSVEWYLNADQHVSDYDADNLEIVLTGDEFDILDVDNSAVSRRENEWSMERESYPDTVGVQIPYNVDALVSAFGGLRNANISMDEAEPVLERMEESDYSERLIEEEWRYASRRVFEHFIEEQDYNVVDFVPAGSEYNSNTYILTKE